MIPLSQNVYKQSITPARAANYRAIRQVLALMPLSVPLETIVNDPLLTRVATDYVDLFYPYGFPVRIRSNSTLVLEAAHRSWGVYRRRFDDDPLDVRFLVSESDRQACTEPPNFRSQGHLLSIVADSNNFACLDLNAGFAFGWANAATVKNQEYFRQCLLEVTVHPLLEIRYLITLHAACVMFRGKGILFAGNSGAGKSSLSYACARRGWTFVSDDASAFRRKMITPTVIGQPEKFRFRHPAGGLFPELEGIKSTVRGYGKTTVELQTDSVPDIRLAEESPVDAIVFLNRPAHKTGPPNLNPVSEQEAWNRLSLSVWAVDVPAFEERLSSLERLLAVPIYEMRYTELDPAIDLLEQFVEEKLY